MRDSCIFYRSFYESIKDLPNEEQALIYNAIFSYSLDFVLPELTGIAKSMFTLIKPQIDANIKRFNNGNAPKTKQEKSKTEAKPKRKRSETQANNNVNDNVNNNNNNNENEKAGETPKTPLELKFIEFLDFRKAKKKPVLQQSEDALKKRIWELSGRNQERSIKIIEQSIANGWTGVFELKEEVKQISHVAPKVIMPSSPAGKSKTISKEERWSAIVSGVEKLYLNGQRFNDMGSAMFNNFKTIGAIEINDSNESLSQKYSIEHYVDDPTIDSRDKESWKVGQLKKLREEWYLRQVVKSVSKDEIISKLKEVIE